jgi:hypothetical protein
MGEVYHLGGGEQLSREELLEELHCFCEEIVWCMMRYGHLGEAEARRRLDETGLCAPENNRTEGAISVLFHDVPYFYALEILHSQRDPQWFNDPALGLWPPPDQYYEEAQLFQEQLRKATGAKRMQPIF